MHATQPGSNLHTRAAARASTRRVMLSEIISPPAKLGDVYYGRLTSFRVRGRPNVDMFGFGRVVP